MLVYYRKLLVSDIWTMAEGDTIHLNGEEENKELTVEKDTAETLKKATLSAFGYS